MANRSRTWPSGVGAIAVALGLVAALGAAPAGAEPVGTSYRCVGSVGDRALGGPSNIGIAGTWQQGSASTSWLIGCTYPDPTFVAEWHYQVAWTPARSNENTSEGCGSRPYSPTKVFVSPDRWAYVSTNITHPPAPLEAAARNALVAVEKLAKPCAAPSTTSSSTPTEPPAAIATVTDVVGDVAVQFAGTAEYVPVTRDTVLHMGDAISTDVDAEVTLMLPGGRVTISELSQVRVNEMFSTRDVNRLQLRLESGRVETTIPEASLIRTDFTVKCPMSVASIRGSAMIVTVADDGVTNVHTTEDEAFVQGTADSAPLTVPEGQMSTVGADGVASAPVAFSAPTARERSTSEASAESSSALAWIVIALLAVAIVGAVIVTTRGRVRLR